MTDLSLTGFKDELRALPIGGSLAKLARVPLDERDRLGAWRKDAMSHVAYVKSKSSIGCGAQSIDAVSDDHSHAIRVLVVTRLS